MTDYITISQLVLNEGVDMKYGIITMTLLILLNGCDQPKVEKKSQDTTQIVKQTYLPPPPKKKIKLKEVDDTNFNSDYMYPEDSKKKEAAVTPEKTSTAVNDSIGKEECIAMISLEKFNQYAEMFGSEEASVKRCRMLKATR